MSESLDNPDKALEARIKASLEQSARYLDADTQQRLTAVRRNALKQPSTAKWFKFNSWIPATSLVFCSVIALLIFLPQQHAANKAPALADQTAMLELLDNPDELDAISDPDFYIWADEIVNENAAHHAV